MSAVSMVTIPSDVSEVISTHRASLLELFARYCDGPSPAAKRRLRLEQYLKLLRDCRLWPGLMSRADLVQLFKAVQSETDVRPKWNGSATTRRSVGFAEFTACLAGCAEAVFSGEDSLAAKFKVLLTWIGVTAKPTQLERKLRRLFAYYGDNAKELLRPQLLRLLADGGLLDDFETRRRVETVGRLDFDGLVSLLADVVPLERFVRDHAFFASPPSPPVGVPPVANVEAVLAETLTAVAQRQAALAPANLGTMRDRLRQRAEPEDEALHSVRARLHESVVEQLARLKSLRETRERAAAEAARDDDDDACEGILRRHSELERLEAVRPIRFTAVSARAGCSRPNPPARRLPRAFAPNDTRLRHTRKADDCIFA